MTKKSSKHWFIRIVVYAVLIFALARVYYRLTDDFRVGNITYDIVYPKDWGIPPLSAEEQQKLDAILAQKFTYLGKGAQSYVFSSEDQQYVLKFFKFKHLRPVWYIRWMPDIAPLSTFLKKESSRKERKLRDVFTGYKLAYDLHRKESGLFFIQLIPSRHPKLITVYDKIGLPRTIDLGEVVYVIQQKGESLRVVLAKALNLGDIALAKKRINQIFEMYLSEYNKGVYDHDHGVVRNAGFIGDDPLHLDLGKFYRNESMKQPDVQRDDLIKVAVKIDDWLFSHYPEDHKTLSQYMESQITGIYGTDFRFPERI